MMAVDTNVLVRFLVRDDAAQAEAVHRRLKRAEADREVLFIPLTVLLETIWVLESAYGKGREEIIGGIEALRRMPIFVMENDQAVAGLLADGGRTRGGLADILIAHAALSHGCTGIITFDKAAAARVPAFSLLK